MHHVGAVHDPQPFGGVPQEPPQRLDGERPAVQPDGLVESDPRDELSVANHGGLAVRSLARSFVLAPAGSRTRSSSSCPKWLRKSASSASTGRTRFTAANFPDTAPR